MRSGNMVPWGKRRTAPRNFASDRWRKLWTAPILLFLVILAWPEGGRASGDAIRPAGPGDVRFVDGDTLWIGRTKIRLSAYDAPERAQTCQDANGRTWRCGAAATERLRALVGSGRDLSCAPEGTDRYGRTLATCRTDAGDLGAILVSEGLAFQYTRSSRYALQEARARIAGRGVWQGAHVHPSVWRRMH